ncbi:MAG: hypothetical protein A2551_00365 [Elusimicrobia bacterium RIFOXYD2_FULL_34_30]|nr:MAG: hypothetical protein A2551_00365 [Elusimicrobia bacterium RIFOXYD2_FULL_34_30]
MKILKITRYSVLFIFALAPFINGLKDPIPLFIFETAVFLLFLFLNNYYGIKKTSLDIPIFLLVVFSMLSITNTLYFSASLNTVLMLFSFILLFYILITIHDIQFQEYFFYTFISISFITSAIIIIQSFIGNSPKATLPNPNLAAGYISYAATLLFAYILFNKDSLKMKMLFISLLFLFYYSVYLTRSRGGIFAIFCGISACLIFKFKKWGLLFLFIIPLTLFIIIPNNIVKNIVKIDGQDAYSLKRTEIWTSAIKIIKEKPFLGTGPGNYDIYFHKHNFPVDSEISRFGKYTRFAHNEFLQLAAEFGLFTLFSYILLLIIVFKNSKHEPILIASFASIIGHSLVDFNLHLPAIIMILIFLASSILSKKEGCSPSFKYINIFVLILLLLNSINFVFKPFNAEKYKIKADKIIKNNPKEALEIYKKIVRYSPNDFEYRRIIGELYYRNGNRINAIKNLKTSIELNPKSPFAYASLANIYYYSDEPDKAETYFSSTVKLEPNYLLARYFLAKINENRNKIRLALNEYKDIILIYKHFENNLSTNSGYEKTLLSVDLSVVYNSIGNIYLRSGKIQEAIDNLIASIEINHRNADAHSNLASAYFLKENYALALKHENISASIEKEEPVHLKNLILIYEKLGEKNKIKELQNKIQSLDENKRRGNNL